MSSRESFEVWASGKRFSVIRMSPGSHDTYASRSTEFAWLSWQVAEKQALERAVKTCDSVSVDRWNLYKGRSPYTGSEDGRASPHVQGESDGADKCAEAIRALMKQDASSEKEGS